MGWLHQMEAAGLAFKDPNGQPKDCLQILKDHGINTVRLRVFVNSNDDPVSGHCRKEEVAAMAERAQKLGLRILIDFHYSDTWADPAHQTKPAAWKNLSFDELLKAVRDHTTEVLQSLKAKNITPEWVQIGNEIPDGLLWPDGRASKNPEKLARLINAGHDAVKAIDPRIKTIVHLDRGADQKLYRWFFDQLEKHGGQFDVIGMSYYPYWDKVDYTKSIDALGQNMIECAARYKKEIMLVEIGGLDSEPDNTFNMIRAAIEKVCAVPGKRGLGVLYWEPAGRRSWSKYPLSCWQEDGKPTRALKAFSER